MKRTPEVIDCWFDSGSMPFAQYHYPFENKDLFDETFPADFISEAVDQTRGWFYTLLVISTILFGKAPFKNCIVLGHVNDKNGVKMSKHKGNVVDPWSVLDKQGADAVRWYFYTCLLYTSLHPAHARIRDLRDPDPARVGGQDHPRKKYPRQIQPEHPRRQARRQDRPAARGGLCVRPQSAADRDVPQGGHRTGLALNAEGERWRKSL